MTKPTERKRLTAPQIRMLERAMKGTWLRGSSQHQCAERLYRLGLVWWSVDHEFSKQIRATHDGAVVLKQNGYYPADPEMRASVRDPAEYDAIREAARRGDVSASRR